MADPLLFAIVRAAEAGALSSFPITLNVHGAIVSGLLCGRAEYEVASETFLGSYTGEASAEGFKSFHEHVRDIEDEVFSGNDVQPEMFVHLKDAQFILGTVAISHPMPWRGKLSSVDAFSLGLIRIGNAEQARIAPPQKGR